MQSYLDLLVGAVSGLKAHLEGPGNSLVVNLVLEKGGVALSPTMEELLKVGKGHCSLMPQAVLMRGRLVRGQGISLYGTMCHK